MEKKVGIYIFKNKINEKVYIGQSVNIEERVKKHKYSGSLFHRAIQKHGWDNFYYEILEECDDELLDDKEEFYIKEYNSANNEFGYNILKTARENPVPVGSKRPQKLKDQWSKKRKGKGLGKDNPFYGKTHTDKFKKEQSERKSIL